MKLFVKQTRDLSFVPNSIWVALILSLFLQCLWHFSFSRLEVKRYNLTIPPPSPLIRLASLDDPVSAAKLTMLWLQAFDNQPGVSIPLKELNYGRVVEWLDIIIELDSKIQYPLLAAIRFYAEVQDAEKQRMMISYVSEKFIDSPNERWSYMAHAVYVAKHRIKDLKLALECAKLIRQYAKGDNVPYWAKQMEIFILELILELLCLTVLHGIILVLAKVY